jgi:tetratricopeptide (TPR) repeat protein
MAAPWIDTALARPRLLVVLAAVLPFLGTLGNEPVLDDGWAALDNPLVWKLGNAGRIFQELYGYAGDPTVRGPYRPLTTLSYALNWAVHGRWTPGFHAVNVALHALASLLVLALARRLFRAAGEVTAGREAGVASAEVMAAAGPSGRWERPALLAALLFAVHPCHVEAVATIFGRTEPLSAAFALGALWLALGWREAPWRLPAAVLVLSAGVLSKEIALVTPALFLLAALAAPGGAGLQAAPGVATAAGRRALAQAAGVAGALSLSVIPYLLGKGTDLAALPNARWFGDAPGSAVALTMSRVMGEYWRILAFPTFLGGDFAYAARLPTIHRPTPGFLVATAAWLALLGLGAWLLRSRGPRRAPLAGAGILWTFVGLLPVMQIIPVGVLLAERLLYLPSVGFCLAAAALFQRLTAGPATGAASTPAPARARAPRTARGEAAAPRPWWRPPPAAVHAGVALGLALLAGRTVARTLDWRTTESFWESELAKAPREVVVNNNLAVAYSGRGEFRLARERLRVALEVSPGYWRAWVNLGIAEQRLGDRAAARRAYDRAVLLAPTFHDPLYWLAGLAREEGNLEEAATLLGRASAISPEQGWLARQHGEALLAVGRRHAARQALERAVKLDPRDAEARRLLAGLGAP